MQNIGFMCITKEADLMLELLKHGAKPTDDMIHQSSVVRMCALGLVNLKGCQSVAAAAMMVCACLHHASCQNALNLNKYISISFL
jgi:hypothetical protein